MKRVLLLFVCVFAFIPRIYAISSYKVSMTIDGENNIIKKEVLNGNENNVVLKKPSSGSVPGDFYGYSLKLDDINSNTVFKDLDDGIELKGIKNAIVTTKYKIGFKKSNSYSYFTILEGINKDIENIEISVMFKDDYIPDDYSFYINGKVDNNFSVSKNSNMMVAIYNGNLKANDIIGLKLDRVVKVKNSVFSILAFCFPIFCLFVSFLIWYFFGKDKDIVIEKTLYPDRRMNYFDIVRLYKEKVSREDIINDVIMLCSKGYIKIVEKKDDLRLVRVKNYNGHSYSESLLFDALFLKEYSGNLTGVVDKNRKKEFYDSVSVKDIRIRRTIDIILANENIDSKIYEYYERGTNNKKNIIIGLSIISMLLIIVNPFVYYNSSIYIVFGMFVSLFLYYLLYTLIKNIDFNKSRKYLIPFLIGLSFFVLVFGFIVGYRNLYELTIFVGVVCIIIMLVLAKYMPKRTIYGSKLYAKIEGLKLLLEEGNSKDFNNILELNENYFYDIIPYTYLFVNRDVYINKIGKYVNKPCDWFDTYEEFKYNRFNKVCDVLIDILRENN